jgi:cytochrome c1
MAITTLSTEIKAPNRNPTGAGANALDTNFTAPAVASDGIDFVAQGNEVIVVLNSGAAPYTFSIISEADALGRTGDLTTYSLAAGEAASFQLPREGWADATTGKILITMENVAVKVLVLRPNGLVNS